MLSFILLGQGELSFFLLLNCVMSVSVSCLFEPDSRMCTALNLSGSRVLVNHEEGRWVSPSKFTGYPAGHFLSHQVSGLTLGIRVFLDVFLSAAGPSVTLLMCPAIFEIAGHGLW